MEPMLCSPAAVVPEGANLLLEPKYDGWRALFIQGVGLRTRKNKVIDGTPYIESALENLPDGTILDGEIVDLASDTQWNRTQTILSRKKPHTPTEDDPALTFVVFDLLELNGTNLMGEDLDDRKKLLNALFALLPADGPVRACPEHPCTEASLDELVTEGYEGVVVKRRDSRYVPGARNGSWVKCKPETEVEVEITGMYEPEAGSKYAGRAVGGFEFVVCESDPAHEHLNKFAGRCGTGMDDALRTEMREDPNRFIGCIAEVKHWGIGATGALRFPSLKRIRDADDKAPDAPVELNLKNPTKGTQLLEKMLAAEEERDDWRDRALVAERKLQGFLAKAEAKGSRAGGRRIRNYSAMSANKLIDARDDLRRGSGPAYDTCLQKGSNDPQRDLKVVEGICRERGL